MFWTLIAVICAGFGGAGIGMLLRNLLGKRVPAGLVPVMAGLAMLAASVAQEYGWFENNLDDLPDDRIVLAVREQQAVYQPWTYVKPWVRGFVAFSPSEAVQTEPDSGVFASQIHIRERWQPGVVRPILLDCEGARRGDLLPHTEFDARGQPVEFVWSVQDQADDIIRGACTALAG